MPDGEFKMIDMELKMIKLYVFDLDGTLVEKWTANILPNVVEKLKVLEAKKVLYTNQGGPACRDAGWGEGYPDEAQVAMRVGDVVSQLLREGIYFEEEIIAWAYKTRDDSYIVPQLMIDELSARPGWRKPGIEGIEWLADQYNFIPRDIMVVGDGDADFQLAWRYGCGFQWAKDFFEWGE